MDLSVLSDVSQFPLLYVFVIGLVTAIRPCPLSANVTAIAYVPSKFTSSKDTIVTGTLYTIGRAATCGILGLLAFLFGSAVMDHAPMLRDYVKIIVGPILVTVGIAMFALAFCPYSAVMFFGLLIPLALDSNYVGMSYPLLFGTGTGLPVLVFAVLLGISATFAKAYIARVVKAEPYVRKTLGAVFLLYGSYLTLTYLLSII